MASQLIHELAVLVGDLCGAPSSQEQAVLFDVQLARWLRSLHALKKREGDGLNVAVLALAKSGKSTLLNALVGAELLPMNNVPETARICKVVHDAGAAEPFLVEAAGDQPSGSASRKSDRPDGVVNMVVTAKGEAAVRARLQHLNQAARGSTSGALHLQSASSLRALRTLSPSSSLGAHSAAGAGNNGLTGMPSLSTPTAQQHQLGEGGASSFGGLASVDSGESEAHMAAMLAAQSAPAVATGLPADKMLSIHVPIAALLEYEQGGTTTTSASASTSGPAAGAPSGPDASAPAAAAGGQRAAAVPAGHTRLQLLDTPGPNEAGEEGLKHQVARLLDGVDAAVYVLDYTKLKTDDEAGMFERLTSINPALVKRLSQRMFFVVNKVDAAQVSEGQDLNETRAYVADLVTRQMQLEGFRLQPEQVLLTSARNALLSRLVIKGKAGPETKQRFVQLAFGRFANPAMIPQEQMTAAAHALLQDSGLLDLESQVLAYLHTHAASVKHLALVDDIGRLLAEVRNVTAVCEAALAQSAGCLASHVSEVRGQLADTLAQFEAVTRNADTIGEEVSREVRAHLQTLRSRLYSAIVTALDTEGASSSANNNAAQPQQQPHLFSRGWHRVRERFLSMFTSPAMAAPPRTNITYAVGGHPAAAAAAAGGGAGQSAQEQQEAELLRAIAQAAAPAARSRSKEELASLLLTLHEELTAQIHAEVREFWGVMEAVAAARHAELLATLNAHLAQLSLQVEAAVSQRLPVRLAPVDLSLQPPDASQFHADLDQLLSRGLVETHEKHLRVSQREVVERVRRHGICRWGDYWESVPRVRTVVEAYTMQVYELVPQEITQQFVSMVDSAIDTTQASLESYVSQFVHQQLSDARQQLKEYSDSYLSVMSGALETSTRNSEHQTHALAQVKSFLERLNGMTERYEGLRRSMEGAVPRAHQDLDLITFDEEEEEQDEQEQEQEEQAREQEAAALAGAGVQALSLSLTRPQDMLGEELPPAAPHSATPTLPLPSAPPLPAAVVAPSTVDAESAPAGATPWSEATAPPLGGHGEGSSAQRTTSPFASAVLTPPPASSSTASLGAVAVDAPGASGSAGLAGSSVLGAAAAPGLPSSPPAPPALLQGPFDYGLAMSSAMSSSRLQARPDVEGSGAEGSSEAAGAAGGGLQHEEESEKSDEWDLVEALPAS